MKKELCSRKLDLFAKCTLLTFNVPLQLDETTLTYCLISFCCILFYQGLTVETKPDKIQFHRLLLQMKLHAPKCTPWLPHIKSFSVPCDWLPCSATASENCGIEISRSLSLYMSFHVFPLCAFPFTIQPLEGSLCVTWVWVMCACRTADGQVFKSRVLSEKTRCFT